MPPQERDRHDFLTRREIPDTTIEDESSPDQPAKSHEKSAVSDDGNKALDDDEISPGNILQYIICMITNFILHLLGINWLLGIFGLALNPLDALDSEETRVKKLEDKKRKFDEMEQVVGESGDHEYIKRTKTTTVELDESFNDIAEESIVDSNMNMEEKLNIAEKTKAISEFQKRLWKLTPDFSFEMEGNQSGFGLFDSEDKLESPSLKDNVVDFGIVDHVLKKKEMLKVITPTDSFDDVLNMSEDASDAATGEEVGDVNIGDDFQLSVGLAEEETLCNLRSTSFVRNNEKEDESIFEGGDVIDVCMVEVGKENECDPEKVKDGSAIDDFFVESTEYCGSVNGHESLKATIQINTLQVDDITEIDIASMESGKTMEFVERSKFDDLSKSEHVEEDKVSDEDQVIQCAEHVEVDEEKTGNILDEEIPVILGEEYGHPQDGDRNENESDYTGSHQQNLDILVVSCQSKDIVEIEQGGMINESQEEKDPEIKIGGDYEMQQVVNEADIESDIGEKHGQSSSINSDPYHVDDIDMIGKDLEVSASLEKSVTFTCENLVPSEEEDREVEKCDPEKVEDGPSSTDLPIEDFEHCESVDGLDENQKATDMQVTENINEIEIESTEMVETDDINTSEQVEICNKDLAVERDEIFEVDQESGGLGGLRKLLDGETLENLSEEHGNREDSCPSIATNIGWSENIHEKEHTELKNSEQDEVQNEFDIGSNVAGKREQRSSNNEDNDEFGTINEENDGDFPIKQLNVQVPDLKTPSVAYVDEIEIDSMEMVESHDMNTSQQVEVGCNKDLVVEERDEIFEVDQESGGVSGLRKILDGEILENLTQENGNREDSCYSIATNLDWPRNIPEKEEYTQLKNFENFEQDQVQNQSDIESNGAGKHEQSSSNNEDIDEIDTINEENDGDFLLDHGPVHGEKSTLPPKELEQDCEGMDSNPELDYSSNDVNIRSCDFKEESLPFQEQQKHQMHFSGITEHTQTTLVSNNESVESESCNVTTGGLQKEYVEDVEETVSKEDFLSDMIKDFKLEGTRAVLQPSDQIVEESVPESVLGDVNSVVGKLEPKMVEECADDSSEHGLKDEYGQLEKKDEEIEEDGVGVRRGSVGSKGKWGQRSSGKKKKKRKIL